MRYGQIDGRLRLNHSLLSSFSPFFASYSFTVASVLLFFTFLPWLKS
jgi:hypothetical protein